MDAVHTSETSVYYNETARRNIPEGSNCHNRRRENLKSHNLFTIYLFIIYLFSVLSDRDIYTNISAQLSTKKSPCERSYSNVKQCLYVQRHGSEWNGYIYTMLRVSVAASLYSKLCDCSLLLSLICSSTVSDPRYCYKEQWEIKQEIQWRVWSRKTTFFISISVSHCSDFHPKQSYSSWIMLPSEP
jgi:hypothetical protein